MDGASLEIIHCPPRRVAEAVALVLSDIAPSQRGEIAGGLLNPEGTAPLADEALYVVLRDDRLRGAAWGQRQPGSTAVLWPPQLVADEPRQTAHRLAGSVISALDRAGVEMTQALLPSTDAEAVPVLEAAGFRHLADLFYLSCESPRFSQDPAPIDLEFEPYDESQRARLAALLERTYVGTLDCAALNGLRDIDDVIAGYQGTGFFRPENWLLVRSGSQDVGVLLLADHPAAGHWELMYLGLAPEARGRGWGAQIARYAQWLGRRAGVERIVLAVDISNEPALRMYRSQGFEIWDRRTVYVRFRQKSRA